MSRDHRPSLRRRSSCRRAEQAASRLYYYQHPAKPDEPRPPTAVSQCLLTILMSGRLLYKPGSRSRGRRALPVQLRIRTPYHS